MLDEAQISDQTDRTGVIQKLVTFFAFGIEDPWENRDNPSRSSRRNLQDDVIPADVATGIVADVE